VGGPDGSMTQGDRRGRQWRDTVKDELIEGPDSQTWTYDQRFFLARGGSETALKRSKTPPRWSDAKRVVGYFVPTKVQNRSKALPSSQGE